MTRTHYMIASILLAAGCASEPVSDDRRCEVQDISAVFASPMSFHGMWFCGEGYLYERSELTAIYDRPVVADEQRYDIAFLLDARSARASLPAITSGVNVRVFVRGRIDAATCNSTSEPSCVPVSRGIFLMDSETRTLN